MMYLQKKFIFLLMAVLCVPNEESKQEPNKCIFKFWKKIFHKRFIQLYTFFHFNYVNPTRGREALKAPTEKKLHFWHHFVIQLSPKNLTFLSYLWKCLPYYFGGSKWPKKGFYSIFYYLLFLAHFYPFFKFLM